MAVQPYVAPVVEIDHLAKSTKKTWTRRLVAVAFGPVYEDTINQLFTRALELVEEHDIRLNAIGAFSTGHLQY